MTCIVGYVYKNEVWMGGDSVAGNTSQYENMLIKNSKVFIKNNMLFGYTSSFRLGDLLEHKLEIPKHEKSFSVEKYMKTIFIDSVIKCMTDNKYAQIESNVANGGIFMVGYKNRLFLIQGDFSIIEYLEPICSCGCGSQMAKASMKTLLKYNNKIEPKKLLTLALEITSEFNAFVKKPFKILKLKNI
jgi:ATP-dependent protease HslVU (ClpYQ) peptidase subunit